ncbi:MAG TPA: M3 family oligoendopeptidase [Acholeplasma sp.]|jgi:pepF/M3 family oligoendopeptidase
MGTTWNLDDLYKGFDESYQKDLNKLDSLVKEQIEFLGKTTSNDQDYIEGFIHYEEEINKLAQSLYSFASLTTSTDVTNTVAQGYLSKITAILRQLTSTNVKFTRYLATVDLDKLAKTSDKIHLYLTILKRQQDDAKHMLSEKEEILYSKLSELSSRSWGQLQQIATANLMIEVDGKELTFSDVRNLAYSYDPKVRKEAYEKELKAYEKIDDFIALALTNIKREVNVMMELRGYSSALERTLKQSNLKKETLDAMISAMMDYRVHFERYLKAKANHLGHKNGLPFYDLFAPVGKLEKEYSYDEAKALIIDAFGSYSPRLSNFAKKAFDNDWIDVYPKKGKRGGAFCSNQPQIKQSRILTNFTGSLDNVSTLAHELGHGYHGEVISDNAPLHWDYPMPLAETASIFCETIMSNYLQEKFENPEEKLSVLELRLQSDTQVIIDILSRFIFESKVMSEANRPISKHEMKAWMLDAQKEAYGEGLDPNYLHPYMWLVKGHYYSAGLNFYNFPYAFGLLFGKGLYAQYLKDKTKFIEKYDELLKLTTKEDAEVVAQSMGIDITQKSFWIDSLEMIRKDIEEVIKLL